MFEPSRILIAIPTYRRPEGLARLLHALDRMVVPVGVALQVAVLDNCPDRSAAPVVHGGRPYRRRPVYAHVSARGLSEVRNAALAMALAQGASHLGFIDDDEWPGVGWLRAHLETLRRSGADASIGPVLPVFDQAPPRWLRRLGVPADIPEGTAMGEGHSSNALLSLEPVRAHGLCFDPRYNLTGGEDTAFFAAYLATGARIVWCPAAPVREAIPAGRATLRWHLRRWRRTGQTNARLRLERGPGAITRRRCLGAGILRLGAGTGLAVLGAALSLATRGPGWAPGMRVAARGLGYLDAARGRFWEEYAAPER